MTTAVLCRAEGTSARQIQLHIEAFLTEIDAHLAARGQGRRSQFINTRSLRKETITSDH